MPLYDVQCEECGREFEAFVRVVEINRIRCEECGGICKTLITCTRSKDWFQPHWSPNFELDPVYVKSRNHFRELCVKHDVTSKVMGDVRNRKY